MKKFLLILIIPLALTGLLPAQPETASQTASWRDMHLGLFVHYMHPAKEYSWGSTTWADGSAVASLDELADNFDADNLAAIAASMRAQYVIFTAWHANMNALFPGEAMKKWLPAHCSKRDLIRDLITALQKRNIRLVLYIHPSDGHDFTKEDQDKTGWNDGAPWKRWNDFINEVIGELTTRYGSDIAGYYIDGGIPPQVDTKRLHETITSRKPDAWLIQNSGLRPELVDYGALERMDKPYPASTWLMCHTPAFEWWAMQGTVTFCPELAYRYTVLQAAVNGRTGGGVAWSFGPHPGGRWELGIPSFCDRLGRLMDASGPSVVGTRPSKAFVTPDKTPLTGLKYAATESADGKATYLHVFMPQRGTTLSLPAPADGRTFTSARMVNGRHTVSLAQSASGITLILDSAAGWDEVDTIIELR
jgi:hypothetical protein